MCDGGACDIQMEVNIKFDSLTRINQNSNFSNDNGLNLDLFLVVSITVDFSLEYDSGLVDKLIIPIE